MTLEPRCTPAAQISSRELSAHVGHGEAEVTRPQCRLITRHALCTVAVDAQLEGVAPAGGAGDDHRVSGLVPALGSTELEASRHHATLPRFTYVATWWPRVDSRDEVRA